MSGKTTHTEEVTSGATMPKLKFFDATIEVEKPSGAGLYRYCACGGGGGCSSGGWGRTTHAARIQRV